MLMGTVMIFLFLGEFMYSKIQLLSVVIFNHLHFNFADLNLIAYFLHAGLLQLFSMMFPLLFGVASMALIFNILQTGWVFSPYPLKPKWSRLNLFNPKNYIRNFGAPAAMKLFFGLMRLNLILLLSWLISSNDAFVIFSMVKGTPEQIGFYIYRQGLIVGAAYSIAYIIIAIFDFIYQRWRFMREMRMSRREVKDELKQIEGDQTVKTENQDPHAILF